MFGCPCISVIMYPTMLLMVIVVLPFLGHCLCTPCHPEFEETVCQNFVFSPELLLHSATNRVTIQNASGAIIHENLSNLENVTEIRIKDSNIEKIESGALCCTPSLTSVIIVATRLPAVNKRSLAGCHNLKTLYLDGDFVLDKGAFTDLSNLQSLSLNGTVIGELEEGVFTGLDSVKWLTIQNSKIRTVSDGAFRGIRGVKVVDLQSNQIETVTAGAFRGFPKLKVLNLSDNKIGNLTWGEFDDLKSLRVLFLERNEFATVDPERLLKGAPNLERIFLSYDKLTPESRAKAEAVFPKHNVTVIYSPGPTTDQKVV